MARVRATVVLLAASLLTAGCAAPSDGGALRPLFRAGRSSYPAAGPWADTPSGWYSPRKAPQFDATGVAARHNDPFAKRRGLSAWFSRLFARRGKPEVLTAIAPAGSALPVPSIVYVTNLQTYATVKVRVEQRAPMGKAVISLGPQALRELGAPADRPLMVRVRYSAPMVAYREAQPLGYARRRPAPAELQLAAAPVAERPVQVASNLPVPALRPALPAPAVPIAHVQAAAFADPKNAERAMVLLARTGVASIEPVRQGDRILYRVLIRAPVDPRQAEALRAQVARFGFADARLIRPS